MRRSAQQHQPGFAIVRRLEHTWERRRDQRRACERLVVSFCRSSADVQRLGTVSECVHGRPGRFGARQVECQVDVVDERDRMGAGAAALHATVGRADAVEGRPLGARVRRRDVHERQPGLRGRVLGGVDRRAAADGENAVRPCVDLDALGWHLPPAADVRRQSEVVPAVARDQERIVDAGHCERIGKLVERPAHDHEARRSFANSTNACAARVSARPAERTR